MSNYDEVIIFKEHLKNLNRYKSRINELELELMALEYKQEGVSAIDTAKEPTHIGIDRGAAIIQLTEPIDRLRSRINTLKSLVVFVEYVLDTMTDQERAILIGIYQNNVTYAEMAGKVGYSQDGLRKYVNRLIKSRIVLL